MSTQAEFGPNDLRKVAPLFIFFQEYDEVSILADLDEILDSEIDLNKIESKSKNPKDRRNQLSRSSSALNYTKQSPGIPNRFVSKIQNNSQKCLKRLKKSCKFFENF